MFWESVYVGVGSNLDQPALQVQRALEALAEMQATRLVAQSSLYGSKPWGFADQPDFVNAVAGLLTQLSPQQFFQALRTLESRLGRKAPQRRWGPRRIDLDLLVFGHHRIDTPELQIPHPAIAQRSFVLYPLRELAPDLPVPGSARVAELAARLDGSDSWRLPNPPIQYAS